MTATDKYGDKWAADKLQRKEEAEYLTNYLMGKSKQSHVSLNNGSFVLNINADWGFGKTYFLQNWADYLAEEGHPVIYFDAWSNDFSKEPLVAFISIINTQLEPYFHKKVGAEKSKRIKHLLSEWYKHGKQLINVSSPLLLGILAKKVAGMSLDQLAELCEEEEAESTTEEDKKSTGIENTVSSIVSKAASQRLAAHNSKKQTIIKFKESLGKLTEHLQSSETIKTPLFIFVDELDRCRPNYAIELLENIKHLFGVNGVYFVVATASEQLCHSIQKVYGHNFDSVNYLKRFFDQTYTLSEPDRYDFANYLFNQYGLADRDNIFSPLDPKLFKGKNINVEAFAFMSDALEIGLRDMMQYCIIIDAISLTTLKNIPTHLMYLVFLMRVKDLEPEMYKKILAKDTIQPKEIAALTVNMSKRLSTCSAVNQYQKKPDKITAYRIIREYIDLAKDDWSRLTKRNKTGNDIMDAIAHSLQLEMQNQSGQKNILPRYPKLIEQAGRFSP